MSSWATFFETYIGPSLEQNQLGRWDSSQHRAVEKAAQFLPDKLARLS